MPQPVILFDGVCNLCNGFVDFVIVRDGRRRFRFASLQSAQGQALVRAAASLPGDVPDSIVLVGTDGIFYRSTAVLRVLRGLRGAWPMLYALIVVPRPIRDVVYDWVARHRYRIFGTRDTCRVPTAEERSRFVE
jgi:predicted DCC family thiol-disulfide oxidoreductase YuxK